MVQLYKLWSFWLVFKHRKRQKGIARNSLRLQHATSPQKPWAFSWWSRFYQALACLRPGWAACSRTVSPYPGCSVTGPWWADFLHTFTGGFVSQASAIPWAVVRQLPCLCWILSASRKQVLALTGFHKGVGRRGRGSKLRAYALIPFPWWKDLVGTGRMGVSDWRERLQGEAAELDRTSVMGLPGFLNAFTTTQWRSEIYIYYVLWGPDGNVACLSSGVYFQFKHTHFLFNKINARCDQQSKERTRDTWLLVPCKINVLFAFCFYQYISVIHDEFHHDMFIQVFNELWSHLHTPHLLLSPPFPSSQLIPLKWRFFISKSWGYCYVCSTRDWTYGLTLARQVFYHWGIWKPHCKVLWSLVPLGPFKEIHLLFMVGMLIWLWHNCKPS